MRFASRRRIIVMLRRLVTSDQLLLLIFAVFIGAAAAYGAIAFRFLVLMVQGLGFGTFEGALYVYAASLPPWQLIAVPTFGGLVIGLFVHFIMPERRPGVADVIEAVALRSGRIGVRAGLGAALVSAASIGVGGSVGREGPVVHLGAALSSWLGHAFGFGRSLIVTLLGCGVAAAIAASFNAPIAGVFFALEVVIGHYALTAFAPIGLASVTGTLISRIQYGDFPAFVVPSHSITSFFEFPAFALLGVISAAVAVILIRSIAAAQATSDRTTVPRWLHPALGGLVVGLIALAFPHVLGVGYGATDEALNDLLPLWLLIALVVGKTVAVTVSIGSGFGGGVFSPSLFLGAWSAARSASSPFPHSPSCRRAAAPIRWSAWVRWPAPCWARRCRPSRSCSS